MNPVLDYAFQYAQLGWRVFPLLERSKKPAIPLWPQAATVDRTTLREWFSKPPYNIAVVCGASSGIVVLDTDPRHGGDNSSQKLIEVHGPLPDTVTQLTGGGGLQHFFKYPQSVEVRNSAGKLGLGLDIRGEGGYVVVPPSVHPATGAAYEWEASSDPLEGCPIAEPPRWLIGLLTNGTGTKQAEDKPLETIPEGRRNNHLASLAGSMRRRGMSPAGIEAALLAENAARCDPPLPEVRGEGDRGQCVTLYASSAPRRRGAAAPGGR